MPEKHTQDRTDGTVTRRLFTQSVAGAAAMAAIGTVSADDRDGETGGNASGTTTGDTRGLDPLSEAFTPGDWDVLGPFQYQRRGLETGWLVPNGGEPAYENGKTPDDDQRFQSAFAGGTTVTWRTESLAADETTIPLDFSDRIDPTDGSLTPLTGEPGQFDDFQDWFGAGGVLYAKGYAVASFDVESRRRAVLETDASTVWLNGRRYEEPPVGVVLEAGTNHVLLKTTLTFASGSASISFRPPRAAVEVNSLAAFRGTPQNAILPDLHEGKTTDRPASVRVTNTTGETLAPTLAFAPDSDLVEGKTVTADPPLAPFETRRLNTRLVTKGEVPNQGPSTASIEEESVPELAMTSTETADLAGSDRLSGEKASFTVQSSSANVTAAVSVDGEADERTIPLRIRSADETAWQTTFVSEHDESVQEFSIREPTNPDSGGPFELIVSLHGANVPSINQAGAYFQREDAYVLAPGARGPVNYDHEDLGRLDDLEAMRVMKGRYDIDERAVYLTGHSMGGHGTWHVGLTNPDRFAGLAPSAGWTDHETYLTDTFSRDKLYTFPRIKAVKETALQKNLALPVTENAADGTLPIFALQGGKDTSVPPMHPRIFLRSLANRGLSVKGEVGERYSTPDPDEIDVAYLEVPGQPHWWDAGIGKGTDCVNHPDLRTFLRSTRRDPYPDHVRFYTTNLRIEHRKFWVAVFEQETVHAPTRVDARVTDDGLEIETENVAVLGIDPRVFRESSGRGRPAATVDGKRVRLAGRARGKWLYLNLGESHRGHSGWHGHDHGNGRGHDDDGWHGDDSGHHDSDISVSHRHPHRGTRRKSPDQYGPLQEVHQEPYRLVYGTDGDDAETATNRNLANLRSQRLVNRARAPATVIPDTAVDRRTMAEYNLVLFGRPSSNAVYRRLADHLPLSVSDGRARIGGHEYAGDLGIEFVYPNPERSNRLVQVETGTSLAGVRLTRLRNWIPTQTATPDYGIYDESIRWQGWNACRAVGFFDGRWELDPELGYLRPE